MGDLSCKVLVGNSDVAFHHIARGVAGISLPTGELTDYIGIAEAKLPKEFHLSNMVIFPKKSAKKSPAKMRGLSFTCQARSADPWSSSQNAWKHGCSGKRYPKYLG